GLVRAARRGGERAEREREEHGRKEHAWRGILARPRRGQARVLHARGPFRAKERRVVAPAARRRREYPLAAMRVMKFGGASLRDGPAIERAMQLVLAAERAGRVLLVVSAQEGVTAQLARAAESAARGELAPWDALRVRHRSALAQLALPSDLLDRHLFELRAILEEVRAQTRLERRMRDYVLSFGERMSS